MILLIIAAISIFFLVFGNNPYSQVDDDRKAVCMSCITGVCRIAAGLECPFQPGDRLTEVNGTNLISNAMLAPSLILGARDTAVHLRMIRPEGYVVIESHLSRKLYEQDKEILVMKGGAKACRGIGVVFDQDARSGVFR